RRTWSRRSAVPGGQGVHREVESEGHEEKHRAVIDAPRRMTFVLFQLLLRQREHLVTYQRRHWNLNPLRARPLMTPNVSTRQGFPLTERARHARPGPLLGFAIACGSPIRWIAQHAPNRGSFPTTGARPCRNLALIQ